ncbi:MAG: hypothetical protein J6N95_04845 [Bacilli bacterium]|nr:hypothetical protein [Bacilli bacterium]
MVGNIKELKKKSNIVIVVGIVLMVIGMVIGTISTAFPVDVGNIISIPAFILLGAGLAVLIIGARMHRNYRKIRNSYFLKRDSLPPFDNNEMAKINLLVESSKKIEKGEEVITNIFEFASTKEPSSLIYFKYRLKPADLEKIYKAFSKVTSIDLFDYQYDEYIPYSIYLFELTFSVMALYVKECLDEDINDIAKIIKTYYETNNPVDLKRLVLKGNDIFDRKYRGSVK